MDGHPWREGQLPETLSHAWRRGVSKGHLLSESWQQLSASLSLHCPDRSEMLLVWQGFHGKSGSVAGGREGCRAAGLHKLREAGLGQPLCYPDASTSLPTSPQPFQQRAEERSRGSQGGDSPREILHAAHLPLCSGHHPYSYPHSSLLSHGAHDLERLTSLCREGNTHRKHRDPQKGGQKAERRLAFFGKN